MHGAYVSQFVSQSALQHSVFAAWDFEILLDFGVCPEWPVDPVNEWGLSHTETFDSIPVVVLKVSEDEDLGSVH